MRNYRFFILATLISMAAQATQVTIHVDDSYPPFSFSENGKAKGMYIDVLETAFSRMPSFEVNIVPIPWKRGKVMVENGAIFGLSPVFFHGHDWPYMYPYSLSFYTETIVVICQEGVIDSNQPTQWPNDYIGLNVGNVAGFDGWGGDEFRELVKQKRIRYTEVHGSDNLIMMLGFGRIDCILMEDKAFDYQIEALKKSGQYDPLKQIRFKKSAIAGRDPVYIGFSYTGWNAGKYPDLLEFQREFDIEIYKMTKDGEIDRILDAYVLKELTSQE